MVLGPDAGDLSEHVRTAVRLVADRASDERIAFVKSWNGLGEGDHLEPDRGHGRRRLEAALAGVERAIGWIVVRALRDRLVKVSRQATIAATRAIGLRVAGARRLRGGVTIVTASHDTLPYLRACVAAVRRHSPAGVDIVVVDNASTDGTRRWAAGIPGVRVVRLPINISHGPALDVGVLWLCRTEHFVVLDVDAFPIDDRWLPRLLSALDAGSQAAGARAPNDADPSYVHACCLAMRTRRFVDERHTFAPGPTWDVAQRISQREWPQVTLIEPTSIRGPGVLGTVFGDLVYHNFYAAGFSVTSRDRIDEIDRGAPEEAWRDAMTRYFPDGVP